MRYIFLFALLVSASSVFSQEAGSVVVSTQMDLIKSDYDILFNRVQIGFEGNYFLSEKITGTAGVEMWTSGGMSGLCVLQFLRTPGVKVLRPHNPSRWK